MVTLHPTSKRFAEGFVPMINLRGDKGQMLGARCPQGGYREFRTFTCERLAASEAMRIALRVATQFPGILQVAECSHSHA